MQQSNKDTNKYKPDILIIYQQQTRNNSNFKKLLNFLYIIAKIIYHYVDLVSDFILAIEIFQLTQKDFESTEQQFQRYSIFIFVIILFLIERYSTFIFIKDIIKEKQNQKKINLAQILQCLVITVFYLDPLYIQLDRRAACIQMKIVQKEIIELHCENFPFLLVSLHIIFQNFIQDIEIPNVIYLGFATSVISSIYMVTKIQILKYQQQAIIKTKSEISFQQLPIETQIYITYPFYPSVIKQNSLQIEQHPDLMREEIYLEPLTKNLSIINKLALLIINTHHLVYQTTIIVLSQVTYFGFTPSVALGFLYFLYIPQLYTYLSSFFKQQKNTKCQNFIEVLKVIFFAPFLGLVSAITHFLPLGQQQPLYLTQLRESILINFYNSNSMIFIKYLFCGVQMLFLDEFTQDSKYASKFEIQSDQQYQRIVEPGSNFMITMNVLKIQSIFIMIELLGYGFQFFYLLISPHNKNDIENIQLYIQNQKPERVKQFFNQNSINKNNTNNNIVQSGKSNINNDGGTTKKYSVQLTIQQNNNQDNVVAKDNINNNQSQKSILKNTQYAIPVNESAGNSANNSQRYFGSFKDQKQQQNQKKYSIKLNDLNSTIESDVNISSNINAYEVIKSPGKNQFPQ